MNKFLSLVAVFLLGLDASAQVNQKALVEHFTNTNCSVCGQRNPKLIDHFTNNQDVLHISFHPSRPYASCVLSQHNATENDDRTKHYGLYGSTPKLVISGQVVTVGFADPNLFTPYKGKTTSLDMTSSLKRNGGNIDVEVKVSVEAAHTLGTEKLSVFLVEDTVFYDAPNGEKQHYNVFRKALTSITGDDFSVSSTVGDEKTLNYSTKIHADWDLMRMRVIAVLQQSSDNALIQSEESEVLKNAADATGIEADVHTAQSIELFPNPTHSTLELNHEGITAGTYTVIDITGKTKLTGQLDLNKTVMNVSDLQDGIHFVLISTDTQRTSHRFLKKN